jgi:predicted amidohydrolase
VITGVPGPEFREVKRIALLQMTGSIAHAPNAATLVDAVEEAAVGGATMLFTPEFSGRMDRRASRLAASAFNEADDPILKCVREAASQHGLWVQLGSLIVRDPSGALVNRGYVIDSGGAIVARYDKMHMFDIDLPDGRRWRESDNYRAGNRAVTAGTPLGRIGMMICYDLRFAGLSNALTDAGATLLSIPAAFTAETGAAHWHILLRARAIESGVFIVAAAQTGEHEDGRTTYGHSLVVDPWGEILLDLGAGPRLGFADINPQLLIQARSRIGSLAQRQPVTEVLHEGGAALVI